MGVHKPQETQRKNFFFYRAPPHPYETSAVLSLRYWNRERRDEVRETRYEVRGARYETESARN